MNNLILIPAREGSTRVIDKNLRILSGKPLVAHCVENALQAKCGRVVVTTNSNRIADVAEEYGADIPFRRPEDLSTATASSLSAILHALMWFRENENWIPDMIAFTPPTNPFLQSVTIRNMFIRLKESLNMNSIVTITQPSTHPFRVVRIQEKGRLENGIVELDGKTINDFERSQDWPIVWEGSPGCRLTRSRYFLNNLKAPGYPTTADGKTYDTENCLGYEIGRKETFDIDTAEDFKMAEILSKMI